jgi:hypothetical protein
MTDRQAFDAAPIYDDIARTQMFRRISDLETAPDYPISDTEPLDIQADRVQSHARLWEARQRWEREQRGLDARAAAAVSAERRRAEQEAERTARRTMSERLARVRLAAAQCGLTHRVEVLNLPTYSEETHHLLAPEGHPALRPLHPWDKAPTARRSYDGLLLVDVGSTLETVESWLGLPADPSQPRRPHDSETGRALDDDQ